MKTFGRARTRARNPQPTEPAAFVRDSRTHNVIARGTMDECLAYREAFGACTVESA